MTVFALRSDTRKFIIDLTSSVLLPFYTSVRNGEELVSPSAVSTYQTAANVTANLQIQDNVAHKKETPWF
jgi:hypothetical protein